MAEPSQKTPLSPSGIARQAFPMMAEHNIEPTPVNYAVWYQYVLGDKKELNKEIDDLLRKKGSSISNDLHLYLYNKYVLVRDLKAELIAQNASQTTQVVLAEIMHVIEKFTGDTQSYNEQISEHVNHLSEKIADPALKGMAKEIISRAAAIRDSGTQLNSRLAESKREVTQLKTSLEKLSAEANRDYLTGVGNRKAFETKLEELTEWAKKERKDLCLLMVDIDHFKQFNDKFGHQIGDEVLKKVARSLFEGVKGKDVIARYGGEEFAILLPATPLANGLIVAENLRKITAENELIRKDTGESLGGVTISLGVSRFRPDADSPAMFISRADTALYRSKKGGRNRVTQESFDS